MSEKRYFWLKLKEDFFDDKQIKFLRSLPDGDKIVITYLKMQLKSLKTDGTIRYDRILPSSEEELSLLLDEDLNIVKFTLKALEQINAIEILEDESIYMIAMQELIGSEGSSASRMRNMRAKQKLLSSHCAENVPQSNAPSLCYGEIEVDKELEKDIEIEKEKKLEEDVDIEEQIYKACLLRKIELSDNAKSYISDCLNSMSPEIVLYAINDAVDHQIKNFSYIKSILNRYMFEGYKTLADVKQDSQERAKLNLPVHTKNFYNQFYANA